MTMESNFAFNNTSKCMFIYKNQKLPFDIWNHIVLGCKEKKCNLSLSLLSFLTNFLLKHKTLQRLWPWDIRESFIYLITRWRYTVYGLLAMWKVARQCKSWSLRSCVHGWLHSNAHHSRSFRFCNFSQVCPTRQSGALKHGLSNFFSYVSCSGVWRGVWYCILTYISTNTTSR